MPEAKFFVPAWAMKRPGPPLETIVDCRTLLGGMLCGAGRVASLQANSFVHGLSNFAWHNSTGHLSYLLGKQSQTGWWYYFPVVFLVKTPIADLLLFSVLLLSGLVALVRNGFSAKLRSVPVAWVTILVPAIVYFGLSMMSRIDLGVRHLLPFYPFFFIALAAGFSALVKSRPPWTGGLLIMVGVLLVAESLSACPDYLSFFNLVSGGTWQGPHYLLDSNIDWGEDLKKLKVYMDAHPAPKYCLEYFGTADPYYYGIEHPGYVPRTNQPGERQNMDCMVAISVTLLHDLYEAPDSFTWLRARKPVDRVGGIWIFDLRKPHD
jgi:hypothetical protein